MSAAAITFHVISLFPRLLPPAAFATISRKVASSSAVHPLRLSSSAASSFFLFRFALFCFFSAFFSVVAAAV